MRSVLDYSRCVTRTPAIIVFACAVLLATPAYSQSRSHGTPKDRAKTASPKTVLAGNAALLEPLITTFGETYLVRMAEALGISPA